MEVLLFGRFLVEQGLVSPKDVFEALTVQMAMRIPIGRVVVNEGKLSVLQVMEILNAQRMTPRTPFGEIAIQQGFLTRSDVEELLEIQKRCVKPIGEILVDMGRLTAEKRDAALLEFEELQKQTALEL